MLSREHHYSSAVSWEKMVRSPFGDNFSVRFNSRKEISGSSAPSFGGDPDRISPEEMFISSVASCLMLTYIHLCGRHGLTIISYRDEPKANITIDRTGRGKFESIYLKPLINFQEQESDVYYGLAIRLVREAEANCFLSASISADLKIEPNFCFGGL
jgi:organic hydroperoxide reductase OsmC/OhrA